MLVVSVQERTMSSSTLDILWEQTPLTTEKSEGQWLNWSSWWCRVLSLVFYHRLQPVFSTSFGLAAHTSRRPANYGSWHKHCQEIFHRCWGDWRRKISRCSKQRKHTSCMPRLSHCLQTSGKFHCHNQEHNHKSWLCVWTYQPWVYKPYLSHRQVRGIIISSIM